MKKLFIILTALLATAIISSCGEEGQLAETDSLTTTTQQHTPKYKAEPTYSKDG